MQGPSGGNEFGVALTGEGQFATQAYVFYGPLLGFATGEGLPVADLLGPIIALSVVRTESVL
jgi:hypothetical protein